MTQAAAITPRLVCPLMDLPARPYLAVCAERLVRAAVVAKFRGAPHNWAQLRELLVGYWGERHTEKEGQVYWEGVRRAPAIAKAVFTLVQQHEVIQPVEPYSMTLKGHTIEGCYGILRNHSGRTVVLSPRDSVSRVRVEPDPESVLHYTHVILNHPEYLPSIVFLFPLIEGRARSISFLNPRLILEWADGLVASYQAPVYPLPGSHCSDCVSKKCMAAFAKPQMISYRSG